MESEAVDSCIQRLLSALYPPFEETAATLLDQVFDVLEKTFRHDTLRYVIDFLIPAKHILQTIQQQACAQYDGCLFAHPGWPLCLGERVAVQLAALDWRALRPGDFYLQVAPGPGPETGQGQGRERRRRPPRLLLKWLEESTSTTAMIQEHEVPELAYPHLFTAQWLDGVSRARGPGLGPRLVLAATGGRLRRLPWARLVWPLLLAGPRGVVAAAAIDDDNDDNYDGGRWRRRRRPSGDGAAAEDDDDKRRLLDAQASAAYPPSDVDVVVAVEDDEGEYVELLEVSPLRVGDVVRQTQPAPQPPRPGVARQRRLRSSSTLPCRHRRPGGGSARRKAWLHRRHHHHRRQQQPEAAGRRGRSSAALGEEEEEGGGDGCRKEAEWRTCHASLVYIDHDDACAAAAAAAAAAASSLPRVTDDDDDWRELQEEVARCRPPANQLAAVAGSARAAATWAAAQQVLAASGGRRATPANEAKAPGAGHQPLERGGAAHVGRQAPGPPAAAGHVSAEQPLAGGGGHRSPGQPLLVGRTEPKMTPEQPLVRRPAGASVQLETSRSGTERPWVEAVRSSVRTEQLLAEQDKSIAGTVQPLAEPARSKMRTEQLLAEQDKSIAGTVQPLAEPVRSKMRTEQLLAEQDKSIAGTVQPLAEPVRSKMRTEQLLAEQDESTTGTVQPLAELVRSTMRTEQLLAEQDKSIAGTVQPLAEPVRSKMRTEQLLAEQDESTTGTVQPLAELVRSTMRTEQLLAEQDESTAGTVQPLAELVRSTMRTEQLLAEQDESIAGTVQPLAEPVRSNMRTEQLLAEQDATKTETARSLVELIGSTLKTEQPLAEQDTSTTGRLQPVTTTGPTHSLAGYSEDNQSAALLQRSPVDRQQVVKSPESTGPVTSWATDCHAICPEEVSEDPSDLRDHQCKSAEPTQDSPIAVLDHCSVLASAECSEEKTKEVICGDGADTANLAPTSARTEKGDWTTPSNVREGHGETGLESHGTVSEMEDASGLTQKGSSEVHPSGSLPNNQEDAEYSSHQPSAVSSHQPPDVPSHQLSDVPSLQLSDVPSLQLSDVPSLQSSDVPSLQLSDVPSLQLSDVPSHQSSDVPSLQLSDVPSLQLSDVPSHQSSDVPSHQSSDVPSLQSSDVPSLQLSDVPSHQSSDVPSLQLSDVPSHQSSDVPSHQSSDVPSHQSSDVPSLQLSDVPSLQLSDVPSHQSSDVPSLQSSDVPPLQSSDVPSLQSSDVPSLQSSDVPSHQSSDVPSLQLSDVPSLQSSDVPSHQPPDVPSHQSSDVPSLQSSDVPSLQLSDVPSLQLSDVPSLQSSDVPSLQSSDVPSHQSSDVPSLQSSDVPSHQSSDVPSLQLSDVPSLQLSDVPSLQLSDVPSLQSSDVPSLQSSDVPSHQSSDVPSLQLSDVPSLQSSDVPSHQSSDVPSLQLSDVPSLQSSDVPSHQSSDVPSLQSSDVPSHQSSDVPSLQLSDVPSLQSSDVPSLQSSDVPSHQSSDVPSLQLSDVPSLQSSDVPSHQSSDVPSLQLSDVPSLQSSDVPSHQSSDVPSLQSSDVPSLQLSDVPSLQLSDVPSLQLSDVPSLQSSDVPSLQLSDVPSLQSSDVPSLQPPDVPSLQSPDVPSLQPPEDPSQQSSDVLSPQPPSHQPPDAPSHQPPSPQFPDVPSPQPPSPQPPSPQPPSHQSPSPQLPDVPSPQPPSPQPPSPQPPSHQPPSHQPPFHQPPSHQPPSPQLPDVLSHQPPSPQLPNVPSHQPLGGSSHCPAAVGRGVDCSAAQKEPFSFDQALPIGSYPANLLKLDLDILHSGVLSLPGNRDRNGRGLVVVMTKNAIWENPKCSRTELARILMYYYTISRKEVQDMGLRVLIDARGCRPAAALCRALDIFQKAVTGGIHSILMLAGKESSISAMGLPGLQVELLTAVRNLHKHVEPAQLTQHFAGDFPYCHEKWVRYRVRLESLLHACRATVDFLRSTNDQLEAKKLPESVEEVPVLIEEDQMLMRQVLQDARLIGLQQEGAAILVKLRRETATISGSEDYRDAMETTCALYNQVDEEVHRLVQVSNQRQKDLESLAEFWWFEDQFREVSDWFRNVGQPQLDKSEEMGDSLPALRKRQQEFRDFNHTALEYCQKGQELLQDMAHWESSVSLQLRAFTDKLRGYRWQLADFIQRAEQCRLTIDRTIRLHHFFNMAYNWSLVGIRNLAGISMEHCLSPGHCEAAIASLERYAERHPEIPESRFLEMRELAEELGERRCLDQWTFCRAKCQETKSAAGRKMAAARRTSGWPGAEQQPPPPCWASRRKSPEGAAGHGGSRTPCLERRSPRHANASMTPSLSMTSLSSSDPPPDRREWMGAGLSALSLASASGDRDEDPSARQRCDPLGTFSPIHASTPDIRGPDPRLGFSGRGPAPGGFPPRVQDSRRGLKKAQSFDLARQKAPDCQRALSEPAHGSSTGVFIKGLEVTSTELVDRTCSPREHVMLARAGGAVAEAPWGGTPWLEPQTKGSKPRRTLAEALAAEQEYVGSLAHVVKNYFPEMDRPDVPQDLRGKRGVVFGNLEKLLVFHGQRLLQELQSCLARPLCLGECFLRHKEQFTMYALYVKNKLQSDALLSSHGNAFFKRRQLFLGDRMDLSSYLLKPIQRMISYGLLLQDLINECDADNAQELLSLRAAMEMVRFQLRHGNNLLAMDAIRGCDVNLKEQGQLLRHDRFTVSCGRRKSMRHVFLFEELVVFSKLKRADGGSETYIYKSSLKTADVGLTENIGDSGLRFEVWFRRRRSNEAYVFQAETAEVKQAWTRDVAQILWRQASRNKELRLQEMVSMGMGSKLFLNVQGSDSPIKEPAIDRIVTGKGKTMSQ
uniref:uncharacterized protein n=1 Tax=Pristiophorus japonicus TaxID=55135 RepID=UPI00398ED4B7